MQDVMEPTEKPPTVHANMSACVVVGCQIKLLVLTMIATKVKISTTDPMMVFRVLNHNTSPRRPNMGAFVGAVYGVMPTGDLGPRKSTLLTLDT